MTVLVTGGAGFFGSAIVRALALAGHEVISLDRVPQRQAQTRPDTPPGRVRHLAGDVTDPASLDPSRFGGVTGIVHAAALSLPDEAAAAATILDVNVRGTVNVLSLAGQLPGCTRFLLVSSAGVYDLDRPVSYTEGDATGGRSLYGATKLAGEILTTRMGELLGFDAGVVRPSSLWGPGEINRPTRPFVTPLQQLVSCARAGEAVDPRGLDAAWDWLYVDEATEGLVQFFQGPMRSRIVNLAAGGRTAFRDLVAAVTSTFGLRVEPGGRVVDGGPDRPGRLSIAALTAATGWSPATSLADGLERYRTFLDETAGAAADAEADGRPDVPTV